MMLDQRRRRRKYHINPTAITTSTDGSRDIENYSSANLEECKLHDESKAATSQLDRPNALPNPIESSFSRTTKVIVALVLLVGACSCATILALGITAAREDQKTSFDTQAKGVINQFELVLRDYVAAGLWVHQACRSRMTTHAEFRGVYEYLLASGLEFQSVAFAMNVTHAERAPLENASHAYVKKYFPKLDDYSGFREFQLNPVTGIFFLGNAANNSNYYPIHLIEPLEDDLVTGKTLDYDLSAPGKLSSTIREALRTGQPAVTGRLNTGGPGSTKFHVRLMHPGIQLSMEPDISPRDVAMMTIRLPAIIERAHTSHKIEEDLGVYIFDTTDSVEAAPLLEAATLQPAGDVTFLPETVLADVRRLPSRYIQERRLPIASRQWSFVIVATESTFEPKIAFVILGATMIFIASLCLALWIYTNARREIKVNELRRSTMVVEHANQAAKSERELNEFLAHEVRNPLAAAMSACSFVSSAVNEAVPLASPEAVKSVRDDTRIVNSSLEFINELLRTMLDTNKAASKQLKIEWSNVDLLRDILEPVGTMLYRRGENYEGVIDCPPNLIVRTDSIRLKQIVLNLARNSAKFVREGFVRLRASVVDGNVFVYVEDSGSGVPLEKRDQLFFKFQQSLDYLSQGTGIGLCLCKNLVDLMDGDLWLDESYDSGVKDCPGARFVINLKTPPLSMMETFESRIDEEEEEDKKKSSSSGEKDDGIRQELPESLSVLFVDDDPIVRKLFMRSVGRVAEGWCVQEASNGETALRIVETQEFDLIFLDQYMASSDKQLLGTETARALRAKGVKSIICGLSANDVEKPFLAAGADSFMSKPFPCKKESLMVELLRVISLKQKNSA